MNSVCGKVRVVCMIGYICTLHADVPAMEMTIPLQAVSPPSPVSGQAEDVIEESFYHEKLRLPVTLTLATTPLIVVLRRLAAYARVSLVVDDSIKGWVPLLEVRGEPLGTVLHALLSARKPPCGILMIGSVMHVATRSVLIARARQWLRGRLLLPDRATIPLIHVPWTENLKLQLEAMWYHCCRQHRAPARSTYFFLDEAGHQVLLQGSQPQISLFRHLISQLDVMRFQVSLRARVVVARTDFIDRFGVRARLRQGLTGDDIAFSLGGGALGEGVELPVVLGGLGAGKLELILNWAEQHNKLHTLIAPCIASVSGKTAYLLEGESVPIESMVEESVEGRLRSTRSVHYKEVGMRVKMKPFLYPDNKRVRLEVLVENSHVSPSSKGVYPTIVTSKINNTIVLLDGQSALLGGLTQQLEQHATSSVPFWAKIPVLGKLFRSDSHERVQRRLYIFVTASVVPA